MSLINEALKKAQNQRSGAADAPPMPGGGSGGRGRSGMPQGTLILLLGGGFAIVAISVVVTLYFINRTPAPPPVPITLQPITVPTPGTALPKNGITLPNVGTASSTPAAPAPTPVAIAPIIIHTPPPVVEMPAAPPSAIETDPAHLTAAPGPEPVEEGSREDRIAAFVEKVRVTGIRTSESGSKVLMNDKVYRLNDVVDRKLGLRLVKIASDTLTFADANGATYVKNF